MTLRDVEAELADHLAAQAGLGVTLTRGTNLFAGELGGKTPDVSVLIRSTGGAPARTFLGGSTQVEDEIQVVVRGSTNARPATQTLARKCWEALHHAAVAGYVLIEAEQVPTSMGADGAGRPLYVFNLRCLYDAGA